ncbi:MAG: hypothetical protein A2V83_04450 [Nitrospirae bacterium RBG_16_64_22]|nr:MAG: hypothetical protein A2V83_04450 [Nitrospirae bacterium RBG_16_64_22]
MKVDDSTPTETPRQPNFNHLWLFYNVARFGSVSGAARALRTSQPSISRQVRALADHLGAELYVRKGRTILLTDAGRLLFDHAQRIFTLGADAVRAIQEWSGGRAARLAISAVPPLRDYWLPARLGELLRVQTDLDVRCGPHENIEERLIAGESDVAMTDAPAASGALFSEPLFNAPLVLMGRSAAPPAGGVAGKKRGKTAGTGEGIGEVLAKNVLLVPAYPGWRGPVMKFLEEERIRPARIQVREGIEGLVRCVEEGVGVAFLPAYVSAGRSLARVGGERISIPLTAWVVMARSRNPTTPLLAFLAILRRAAGRE